MLSKDLKRLHALVDDWFSGRRVFSVGDAMEFKRDLGLCAARAAMMEIGVDVSVIDVAAECAKPESNIVMLPRARWHRPVQGEAS